MGKFDLISYRLVPISITMLYLLFKTNFDERMEMNLFFGSHGCKETRFQDCSGPWNLKMRREQSDWVDTLDIIFCKYLIMCSTCQVNVNLISTSLLIK